MMNRRYVVVMVFALLLSTAFSSSALAYPWQPGDVITGTQSDWGDENQGNTGGLLLANYDTVYASTFGVLEVGIPGTAGFSMAFADAEALIDYLPKGTLPGPLDRDYANPTSTGSGSFGADVTALKLNIDFSDAGLTLGALEIPFGDLILYNFDSTLPLLNGLTVREYSDVVNTWLGGGTSIYSIDDLSPIAQELNGSFMPFDSVFTVSQFALDHLDVPTTPEPPPASVPEPATLLLLGSGLAGLVALRRKFTA